LQKLAGANVVVTVDVEVEPMRVACGSTELQQVLMNLVVNAAHALGGGGTIRVRAGLEERARRFGVLLTVSDDGEGIPEDVLPRIFDPYFTTKPRHQGSGLGLSLVYGIVTGAGGDVEVESERGRGTLFRLRLPLAESVEARSTIPPPSRVARRPNQKLLIVEDFSPLLRSLQRVFDSQGFPSVGANSCEEALETFEACRDDVLAVICDVSMPGMSGVELARAIRAGQDELPVVLMSGDERVVGLTDLGPNTLFLRKPFAVEAVIEWLSSVGVR
jgi:CheY-like chemotaxis protein/anti-sigma regulatory factor (Ser/Thr protein kinase)